MDAPVLRSRPCRLRGGPQIAYESAPDAMQQGNAADPGVDIQPADRASEATRLAERRRRTTEFAVTILLALTSVVTSWSGYQASLWSGIQASRSC